MIGMRKKKALVAEMMERIIILDGAKATENQALKLVSAD